MKLELLKAYEARNGSRAVVVHMDTNPRDGHLSAYVWYALQNVEGITMKYYLRNKDRGYLGNSFMWWKKGGHGYTAYLNQAERFDEKDAKEKVISDPSKWECYPCDEIDKRAHLIFDSQDVRAIKDGMDVPTDSDYIDAREILK